MNARTGETLSGIARERRVLVVDDDEMVVELLSAVFQDYTRSKVLTASSVAAAISQINALSPTHAVLDMKLRDGTGLDVLAFLSLHRPDVKTVVLSGYGSLQAAVAAAKLGAIDYLAKPVDAGVIVSILIPEIFPFGNGTAVMSPDCARWEHIRWALQSYGGNVTETARRLRLGRRTLQRIMARHRDCCLNICNRARKLRTPSGLSEGQS